MTVGQQELRFGWVPAVDGGGGVEVEVVDPGRAAGNRVQVVSVPDARRWAAHRAAETGDGRVIEDLEQLLALHGVEARTSKPGAPRVPEVLIPSSPVNELHPEWRGGGFFLRGGDLLCRTPVRRPVSLKGIAGLIFYLRKIGEVAEADRIRAETKGLCAIARRMGHRRPVQPKRPAGRHRAGHAGLTDPGVDVDGGKRGR